MVTRVVFAALAVLVAALPFAARAQGGAAGASPVEVVVAETRREAIADRVEALGTTRANESVLLTSRIAETVRRIRFDDGQRVKAGQVLVELTSDEEDALLEEGRARVREARRQFARVEELAAKNQAAESQLDERRRELETAQAQLQAIRARLADHLIVAPFDGVLGLRRISPGAFVEPGTPITTLSDLSVIKLDFSVPAVYLGVLRPGLTVAARARAFAGRSFQGRITYVDTEVDPVTRAVLVRVLLPNPDAVLIPGLLMTVTLEKDPREALLVPESALIPRGSEAFVLSVGDDGRVARKPVEVGARLAGYVEVESGLVEGERVITHGSLKVRPGQTVEVRAIDRGGESLEALLSQSPQASP
jgi:membrane fusion protein (multidrug efflux system)